MNMNCSYNPRFKSLLKLIFENCNNDKTCNYKIYQDNENIEYISMKLSCISQFVERIITIVKSNLNKEEQIAQIQRFKDHSHDSIFNREHSEKLLDLMKLFINPKQIQKKKNMSIICIRIQYITNVIIC